MGIVLFCVPLVQKGVSPVLAHLEHLLGQHVQKQVESRLTGGCIHFVFEDAGEAPVFRGICGHLYLAGDAVGDLADEFQ